ncbi:hypothetical protein GCM10025865_14410 [Paraoerskovia sediminicola]|uniref:DUF11 domain-containing protein n=1 Tax=Paraoerskovia sediminicola TaxID=1138587 RepID=A0ABM8G252_9CELL|nr:isopeptide-forming domain-containing fimbrial protein [Paraoerskovia sediminicola]BDZ42142.1 hypothetical protein GCM10025865_14410 [Paraoerskovia sediminicola]
MPCSTTAQLWQVTEDSPPTTVFDLNLITGDYVDQGEVPEASINAVGYSALDGWYWGARNTNESTTPPEIVATSPDYSEQELYGTPNFDDVPFGAGSFSGGVNIGDVSPDGIWYGSTAENTGAAWLSVDVDPSSPTFMRVLDGDTSYGTGNVNLEPGDDWSYYEGKLWSIGYGSGSNRTLLWSLDPSVDNANLVLEADYGVIQGPDGINPSNPPGGMRQWGATYTDDAGFLYASNNGTGQIWRFDMNEPTEPAAFFSYGPGSGGNDGSRCPGPLPIDFGDAPDSYDTLLVSNGPFHGVTVDPADPLLTIGDSVTIEPDGQPDASAALDEDDAFTEDPTVNVDADETTLSIPITNNSPDGAALAGWIDFDLSGTFDDDERSVIDTGVITGTSTLTWTVPADAVAGDSYLRLRAALVPGEAIPTDTDDIGPGVDSGEVEDWPITLEVLPRDFGDAPDTYGTLDASDGASHGVIAYDETTNTAPLMLGDANTVDTEDDGVPTPGADGDDLAGVDDEGGVSEPVTAVLGEDLTVDATATNDSATDATLVAWLDADLNGTFDAGEISAAVTVPAETGTDTYALTVPGPASTDDTYLRVRLFAGGNDDPQPTGAWTGGEVEDYLVTVVEPELTITKQAVGVGSATPGQTIEYTVEIENTGGVDYTDANPAVITDDLSEVLDDADYNDDAATDPEGVGAFDYTSPTLTWTGPIAVGETVTLSYSVTVHDPADGDGTMTNVILGPPGSNCEDDGTGVPVTFSNCVVELPVRSVDMVKTSDPEGTVAPGDVIDYTITVTNTGQVPYTAEDPLVITDVLDDVTDDATYNGDFSDNGAGGTQTGPTWTGPLPVGETITLTFSYTVNDPVTGDGIVGNAVTGPPESNCDPDQTPEDPSCTTTNPVAAFEAVKTSDSPDGVVAGDQITYTVEVTNVGGVDYTEDAPASVTDDLTGVLDDATWDGDVTVESSVEGSTPPDAVFTDPNLAWSGPLAVGETVTITYTLTVNDPATGDGTMTNAVVGGQCPDPAITDPDAEGFDPDCSTQVPVLEPSLDIVKTSDAAGPVVPGDTIEYTVTVENDGDVDYTVEDPATFDDDLSAVLDDAAYNDDAIASAGDVTFADPTLSWSGPLAVGDVATITYSVTVTDPPTGDGDGEITNAILGPPEANCPDPAVTDPDDPDFVADCVTTTPVQSLDITKTSDADPTAELAPGETVTYTITVENTGQVAYIAPDLVEISDDLTEVIDDATYQDDAIATSDNADAGTVAYTEPFLTWSGPLDPGETATITYSVVVDDPIEGDGVLTNAVTGPPEANCDPDADPADPDCSVTLPAPVEGVAIEKSVDVTEALPGDVVTYTVTVENTGQVPFTVFNPVEVSDDLTEVLDDADYNGDAATDPEGTGTFDFTDPVLSWSGPVGVGETVTLTYSVTVHDPADGDGVMTNVVTGPPTSTCPEGSEDPDCTTTTPVQSVSIVKTSEPSSDPLAPGGTVTYTVEIENTGGVAYVDPDLLTVSDSLAEVIDDAVVDEGSFTATSDAGGTPPLPTLDGTDLTWTGPLAVGETVTITYVVTVNDPVSGDGVLTNAVTGPPESNCDDPTTPEAETCTTTNPVESLDVIKTSDAVGSVEAGDTVVYTVEVTNTGGTSFADPNLASFTDDLSDVVDDATYNDDVAATSDNADAGTAGYAAPLITWSGPLDPGETATITYSVTVPNPFPGDPAGDGTLTNAVVGGDCPDPAVTDPDDPAYDPDCVVELPVRALDVTKTADPADGVALGDQITYTITVENTGTAGYTLLDPATVSDDLSDVLDDATWDDDVTVTSSDVTATPPDVVFTDPTLTWSGALGAGETVTITYTLTVNDPATGDGMLTNAVTAPGSGCPDPAITDPDDPDYDPDCSTEVPTLTPALGLSKTSDATGEVLPGDTITYTVTVENTGEVDYTDADPATFEDDLTAVLDDATLDEGSFVVMPDTAPAPTFADPTLSWSGPWPSARPSPSATP